MNWKCIKDIIINKIMSEKKVGRIVYDDLSEAIDTIFVNIAYLNEKVDDFSNIVYTNFMSIDDVKLMNEFGVFVTPRSVRKVPGDLRTKDVMIRIKASDVADDLEIQNYQNLLAYEKFWNAQSYIRGCFKKDCHSDVTSIASLKTSKSIDDVFSIASFEDKDGVEWVKYDSNPYVPIKLIPNVAWDIVRPDYFNSDSTVIIKDYLVALSFN